MTSTKKLYGVIISSFILVILHYLMYLFIPSAWDLALKPGNLKAINFITAFFAHLNENHLYSNLISFVLLALSCKKK